MNYNNDTGLIDTILTLDTTQSPPLGGQTNVLVIVGNGAVTLPGGNTAAQPVPATGGMLRYNTGGYLEFYNATIPSWETLAATSGAVNSVTVTTDSPALTVSGGSSQTITSSGTFALSLSTSLEKLSALAGMGFAVYNSSTGNWSQVDITGTAGRITVSNQDGTAGSPSIDLATVTNAGGGSLENITVDGYGRVTGYSAVTAGQLETLLGTYYLPTAGGTMTGAINMGGNQINNLGMAATPAGSDATTVNYVQSLLQGLSWKQAVAATTTTDLGTVTYNNGAAGVGATLTNAGTQAALVVDGYTVLPGDRILVKNESNQAYNGIYVVTSTGSGSTNWVLTRAPDSNTGAEIFGSAVYVDGGSTEANTGWTQTTVGTITVGTTPITWAQFSGTGAYTAGTGLTLTGNTFSLSTPVSVSNGGTGGSSATTAFNNLSPLTTAGDLLSYASGSNVRVGIGSTGQVLTVSGGAPTWGTNAFTVDADGVGSASVALGSTFNIYGTTDRITTSIPTGLEEVKIDISANYAGQSSITTLGTVTTGTWSATAIGTQWGGTGLNASTATNGQLLIGTGSGFALSTLSAGTGITVTNGSGTITLAVDPTHVVTSVTTNTGLSTNVSATGNVTITNTGVLSFATSLSGLTPSTSSTGAVVLAGILGGASGGTGVNNGTFTITLGGNINTGGAFTTTPGNAVTINTTGATNVTFPTSGTLLTAASAVTSVSLNGVTAADTNVFTFAPTAASVGAVAETVTLNVQKPNFVFAGPASGITTAQPAFRALVYTDVVGAGNALQLYAENPVSPVVPVVTGANAVAIGSGSNASQFGSIAFAGGEFANPGDAQHGNYILRNTTTTNTATQLFLDGAAVQFIVPNNSVVTFDILVAARRTDAVGGGAGYRFVGVVRKDSTATSVALIGNASKTVLGETNVPWDANVSVDTATGALRVFGTGETGKTIRWVAVMRTAEVTN